MRIRKSADKRKAEILEAALRLADELGPDRLTAEAIAREVGLTQPGVFRHFPTKQAIWEAVAGTIAHRMVEGWRTENQHRNHPLDRLKGLIHAQLRLIQGTPAIPAILFSRELHAKNDVLRKAFFHLMGRFHKAIAGEVANVQATGTFWRNLDPDDAAFLLIGMVQGLAVRWSLAGRSFSLTEEGARLLDLQVGVFSVPSALAVQQERLA